MTLFSKLFGGAKKTPEELANLQEAGAALEALRQERADARRTLGELVQKRRSALLADESDKQIQALDAEHDRLLLLQERLDAAEPRILARIGELQGKQRRELFAQMLGVFREKESALDAALDGAADALDDYLNTVRQFDVAGFSAQATSVVIRPPFIGVDGVVASKSLLSNGAGSASVSLIDKPPSPRDAKSIRFAPLKVEHTVPKVASAARANVSQARAQAFERPGPIRLSAR